MAKLESAINPTGNCLPFFKIRNEKRIETFQILVNPDWVYRFGQDEPKQMT